MTPVLTTEHGTGLRSIEDNKFSLAELSEGYFILNNPLPFTMREL
jgi:hypothetical protein